MRFLSILILNLLLTATSAAAEGWTTYTNSDWINGMAVHDGVIWCAARGGVLRWDLSDMTCEKFTTMDGLSEHDNSVITVDADGRVWVGSQPHGDVNMYN